uniref:Glycoside hydrolase 35 catalytic domain-containing protein n=1 Tax=Romanomermis culicivorax TaxID=13658 RepID=A0A915JI27_ROMCU
MIGEFWDGWFDRWGDERKILNESAFTEILGAIFRQNASVNLYMFHGGTNFGFMNGANADNTRYLPLKAYKYILPGQPSNGKFAPLHNIVSIVLS